MIVRSLLFHGPGRPLEMVHSPVPEPTGGELRVRVTACTLCRSDLHTHSGRRIVATPSVLGHEVVGRVEAFGHRATRVDASGAPVTIGDRVTWAVVASCGKCFCCSEELPQKCEHPYKYGHERVTTTRAFGGGLADVVVLVPGTAWYRVPDEVPDRVAAPASCATATAAGLLRQSGPIAGRSVLVLGAGVLGVTLCAMAQAAGARAVMVSDPERDCRTRAAAFGATHLFPSEPKELASGLAQVTHGRGADVVLEVAGEASAVQVGLDLLRIGGTLVLAGTVAPVGNIGLDPEKVVRQMLTLRGVHNYHPCDLAAALTFLAGPGRNYPFESLVAASYRLDQAEQAIAHAHLLPGVRVALTP